MTTHDEHMGHLAEAAAVKWSADMRAGHRDYIRYLALFYDREKIYKWLKIPPIVEAVSHPEKRCLAFIRFLAKRLHNAKSRYGDNLPPHFNLQTSIITSRRIWIQGEINMLKAIRKRSR